MGNEIEFHQTPGAKLRPAIVVLDSSDEDFVAAPITSRARGPKYFGPLLCWQDSSPHSLPSTTSEPTRVARAPMFFRY